MNAEDCDEHRRYIDITIFYPWICPCTGPAQLALFELEDLDEDL